MPLWIFTPTLENFAEVQERSDYLLYAKNSVITSVAVHAAGAADRSAGRLRDGLQGPPATRDILMMDAVDQDDAGGGCAGAHVRWRAQLPGLTQLGLIIVFALGNLIMVWMLYSALQGYPARS